MLSDRSGFGPVDKLANLNGSSDRHDTRQERCPFSRVEIGHRRLQPLRRGEKNAEGTEATPRRRCGELPRGLAVERQHALGRN
jgi:hypothetical protein